LQYPKGVSHSDKDNIVEFDGGRDAESISAWINGKIGSNVRIKKAPTSVVVLNSKNFDKVVLDSSKDVLVEFYAPWCGHCKSLAPKYDELSAVYAGEENIVIAKIDCDAEASACQKYSVSGYPTLKWFGKENKKEPLPYESGREVDAFVTFINDKTGAQRLKNGRYSENYGRTEALDALANGFASASNKSTRIAEAEAAGAFGKIYAAFMKAIEKRGAEFIEKELARLAGLMEGNVAAKKRDEFNVKHNILKSFA